MEKVEFNVKIEWIPIEKIIENKGQISGIPKNPRKISKKRLEELKESIQSIPEMNRLNEMKVYPFGDLFISVSGNERLKAYRELGWEECLCKIIPEDWPKDKVREFIIQDNNSYGENDLSVMKELWNSDELTKWNVPVGIYEDANQKEVKGEVPFTEVLDEEHNYLVLYFDNRVDWLQAQTLFGVKQIQCLSTRSDGNVTKGQEKYAVGRVMKGSDAINNLLSQVKMQKGKKEE